MQIALVAIMEDEEVYAPRWLEAIAPHRDKFQEILVVDGSMNDRTYRVLMHSGVQVVRNRFLGDFSAQRNFALERVSSPWVFELDADESLTKPLAGGLHAIARDADQADIQVVGMPRLNFIDGRLVGGPGARGLDYQYRLHRRECRWTGRVHEEIVEYRNRFELSMVEGHYLIHEKDSERHERRNSMYRSMAS